MSGEVSKNANDFGLKLSVGDGCRGLSGQCCSQFVGREIRRNLLARRRFGILSSTSQLSSSRLALQASRTLAIAASREAATMLKISVSCPELRCQLNLFGAARFRLLVDDPSCPQIAGRHEFGSLKQRTSSIVWAPTFEMYGLEFLGAKLSGRWPIEALIARVHYSLKKHKAARRQRSVRRVPPGFCRDQIWNQFVTASVYSDIKIFEAANH